VKLARVATLAVCLGLIAGCGGSSPDKTESPKGKKADKGDDDEEEVSSKGKKWGGWRWKGRRNDCFFIYKNECFSSMKKACKRAKCSTKCEHDDSAPAKVSCKKDKKKKKG
jgi:hypothetical protein